MFSHKEYEEIVNKTIDQIHSLSKLKGGEYAGDTDRLANFRRNAASLGLSMEQVWAVYAAKHWDAIQQYVKDIASGTERVRLEGIEGRADDLIVYLILFKAIEKERQHARNLKSIGILETTWADKFGDWKGQAGAGACSYNELKPKTPEGWPYA